ncbi:hypothetical protein KR032_001120, partial [Drosophila birchii]
SPVTLLAVVALTTVASLVGAADPECIYRKIRGLSPHWPNPTSCSSYYRCSSKSTVRSVTCPAGKEYNPKTGKCSSAKRGLCKLSLVAPLADAVNVCATEVNGAFMAKTGYCGEFFICDEQIAYPQKCESGSYFNLTESACVPDTADSCWQNLCINKASGAFIANDESCGSYYVCSDAGATLQTCPLGSYFDTTYEACVVDKDNSNCWVNYCIGKSDGSAVADKTNCSVFYVCSDNTATYQVCPEGSYFANNEQWECVPGTCPTEPCDDTTTTTEACDEDTTTTTEACDEDTTTTTEACDEDTTTTTESPTGCDCGDIKNADFIPDSANCRKYFICIDGVLVAGDCGKGNLFNANLSVCIVDDKNECCVADCTDGEVLLNVQDCTKYFKCQNGEWITESCVTGSYFNQELDICQVDSSGVCIGSGTTTTTTTTPNPLSTSTAIPQSQCNARDPPASGKNCWSYSACINGQWEEETCLKDYYFDASTGICRQDSDNVCPENRSSGSRQKRSVDPEPTDCNCENGIEQGSIIAHPTDCDKYLICENGQLVEGTCGVGNVFKNCSGVCAPDTGATCWVCSNKPNGFQMVNPTDCTSYITCWNGLATEHTCPAGEWYNSDDSDCEIDVFARCINPCTCSTGNVAHPICTDYFQCIDGVAQVVECPTGQAFNSTSGQCSASVECSALQCATATDGTTFPVNGDSSRFYICLNQEATISACPANSVYVTLLGICQVQPSCQCDQSFCTNAAEDKTYPSLSNDTSNFCICQNGGGYINSCPAGLYYNPTEEMCDFTGNCDPQVCTGQTEYYVSPDYVDSNSFCLCRAGEPIAVPCPIGFTFDLSEMECVAIPQPDPRCCRNGCVGKADYDTLPAIDTTDGFCICIDEVPKYSNCPDNSKYNSSLGTCVAGSVSTAPSPTCAVNACDPSLCDNNLDYDVFPAESDPSGFCYCQNNCPIFVECPDNLVFDEELGACQEPVDPCAVVKCNATECDILSDYTPYLPNDGLDGFCYCEGGMPIYSECPEGQTFELALGFCETKTDGCVTTDCDADKCSCVDDYQPFPTISGTNESSTFCYCDNGEVFLGQCSPDMVFLADEGRCGYLAASECVCAPGKCGSDDYFSYSALNTTEGFCLCLAGSPVFKDCPSGEIYDSDLGICAAPSAKIVSSSVCDVNRCLTLETIAVSFAADNTTTGFCTCEGVGLSIFHSCEEGQEFDILKGFCAIKNTIMMIACNLQECNKRGRFEPFAAQNLATGFCSCDDEEKISVTYHPCPAGQTFAPELGMCASHSIQKRSLETEENFCDLDEKRSVPANCSQYEVCIDGHWRRRTCSDQRYYNPEQKRCLEPRDDLVCAYARVSNLPSCSNLTESQTLVAKNGNCLQFFRCSAGKWRLRNCPKQHYYSPLPGSCLPLPLGHEQEKNQSFCSWLSTKQAINVSADCEERAVRPSAVAGCHSYLMCLDNAWWLQQCPLDMYFSKEHNYCLPNNAGQCAMAENQSLENCSSGDSRSLIGSCHSYELCTDGQWIRQRCQEREQFEPMLGCVPSDGSCQANGMRRICRDGELRAQFGHNCSQTFFYCEAEEWHLGICPRGQSFVKNLNRCQLQAQCRLQMKELAAENQCLDQTDGLSVRDPLDCTRFYLCVQQTPTILQSCPSGSFFDVNKGYCRPNDGSCQLPICSGLEDGKLVAHPEDCRAYYSCSSQNGTSLIQCDEGHYFHSLLQICRVDNGQCRKNSDQNDTQTSTKMCSGLHGVKLAHELYCNLYYACVKGLAIPVECPAQHQFNPVLSLCEPEAQAAQICRNGQLEGNVSYVYSCGSLQDGTFLANRTDCTRYFICAGGLATAQRCAAGSFFDSEQLLCVKDDGSCPLVEQVGDDEDPNNQHVPPDPVVCEGKHGYIMPDPANCNNFYLCVSGKLRHELCYKDYFFNVTLQQCQAFDIVSSTEQPPIESTQSELSGQGRSGGTGTCTDAATTFAGICGVIGNGAFIAEQGDCRRYTSCEDDEALSQRCRNGEGFDSLLGICRQNDGTCLMENGERVGVCNGKHGQLVRNADNCRGYFVCVHGQIIEGDCGQGQFFNKATSSCELDVQQQCKSDADDVISGDK